MLFIVSDSDCDNRTRESLVSSAISFIFIYLDTVT